MSFVVKFVALGLWPKFLAAILSSCCEGVRRELAIINPSPLRTVTALGRYNMQRRYENVPMSAGAETKPQRDLRKTSEDLLFQVSVKIRN
jgi:hypothetical protein